jgi:hypothetical protein
MNGGMRKDGTTDDRRKKETKYLRTYKKRDIKES